ncbi:YcxB family protein [Saezia sanguinis]|uniref:YcxB family protein n=1 Tax=Saezia sanguinis TaxID=1965230 RepID=UPI0013A62E7E|nr:YcxB family protein [Saezia sanguinis]
MDNSQSSVTINNQLNKQDLLAINRTVINHTVGKKYRNIIGILFALFILTTAWFSYTWLEYHQTYESYFSTHSSLPYFLKHMFLPIVFLAVLVIFVIRIKTYHQSITRMALKNPDNSAFFNPSTTTFSDEGLYTEKEYVKGYYQWPAIVKVMDTPQFLLIFVSATQVHFIKKSNCSADELQFIMNLLHRHYTGKIITLE